MPLGHVPPPAAAGDHREREVEVPLLPVEGRQFADGEAVADGHVVHAAETPEAGAKRRPFDVAPADRVRPVEDEEAELRLRGGLHAEEHGGLVRVVARADVLDVEDQRIEPAQRPARRPKRPGVVSVQRVDRDPGLPVPLAARGGHVLDVPADAVFRAEEGGEPDAPRLVEQVRGVAQAPVHRRGVADEPHREPPQGGEALLDEHVEAGPDPLRATPGERDRVSHNRGRYHISFRTSGTRGTPPPRRPSKRWPE